MSLSEQDRIMRHKVARNMRSKMRSEDYQKKRRKSQFYFWSLVTLLLGSPLVYHGAIELGLWSKPTSTSLLWWLQSAWLALAWTWVKVYEQLREFQKREDQLMKMEMEILIEEDTDTPNVA